MSDKRPWQLAAEQFRQAGFRPGDLVTDEWLMVNLGLATAEGFAQLTGEEWVRVRRPFRKHKERFQLYLQRHGGFAFDAVSPRLDDMTGKVREGGLRLVGRLHPLQHHVRTLRRLHRRMRKLIDRCALDLTHIPVEELTPEQRRERAEAQARLARQEGRLVELANLVDEAKGYLHRPRGEWGALAVAVAHKLVDLDLLED